MVDTREQISLKFPAGTRARIDTLRFERESMTAVILRALAALERSPDAGETDSVDSLDTRLAAIETRLVKLESSSRPKSRPRTAIIKYSDAAKRRAIEMRQQRYTGSQIADELEQMIGRRPNPQSVVSLIRRWAVKLGLDPEPVL